ncbi:hypothetical protein AQUCO_03200044v1 [Aquilegia coerulea]|uniref:Uncharacterized protein n=1 Tax=Aquilegia coerulea TaxID=218851 RepID=A0A2G5CZU8_AQUCA|nr:hypothetical protein AQUCO_03200044v1 [Aquilegia coerulea]
MLANVYGSTHLYLRYFSEKGRNEAKPGCMFYPIVITLVEVCSKLTYRCDFPFQSYKFHLNSTAWTNHIAWILESGTHYVEVLLKGVA